jgi:type VI protein secretion system component VasK
MRPLRALGTPASGGPAPIADYSTRLGDLADVVQGRCEDPSAPVDELVRRRALGWGQDYANTYGATPLASALGALLRHPAEMADRVLKTATSKGEATKFDESVSGPFHAKLAGKYPFGDGPPALAGDVTSFFGPSGKLATFVSGLAPGSPLAGKMAPCAEAGEQVRRQLGVTDDGLRAVFTVTSRAGAVRSLGTPAGDQNLRKIDRVTLTINGKPLVDRLTGASENFTWSSDNDDTGCSLSLDHTRDNQKIARLERSGSLWSWFQLVDEATKARDGDGWRLTWTFPEAGIAVDFYLSMREGTDLPFVKGSRFRDFGKILARSAS